MTIRIDAKLQTAIGIGLVVAGIIALIVLLIAGGSSSDGDGASENTNAVPRAPTQAEAARTYDSSDPLYGDGGRWAQFLSAQGRTPKSTTNPIASVRVRVLGQRWKAPVVVQVTYTNGVKSRFKVPGGWSGWVRINCRFPPLYGTKLCP